MLRNFPLSVPLVLIRRDLEKLLIANFNARKLLKFIETSKNLQHCSYVY